MSNDIRNWINKAAGFTPKSVFDQYPSIGANTFMEAVSLNGFSISKQNDQSAKTSIFNRADELSEEISETFEEKGGIITFSINVNAVKASDNKLINLVKTKIETLKNRLSKDNKINRVISKHKDVYGVTIGKFVKGRYKADDGSLYDETSLSIEIVGISPETLNEVAKDLAEEFKQETVLVKSYENSKIYLVK